MHGHNYQLTFEDRNAYLYVRLTGEDSFAASLSYWNKIADQVKVRGCEKLLIHENLVGKVAETEIYDIIMDLMPSGLAEIQIAFYDENVDDTELNLLGQTLAVHKGANVKVFESLQAAKAWITKDA
jgi:hypothetical protein